MDQIIVRGNGPLQGEIPIAGAKNACLTLMPATLLTDEPLTLTSREQGVLEALIARPGRVMSKEQLADQVFGLDEEASPDAIEIYIHRLRKKLEGDSVRIVTFRGLGYLLESTGD